MDWTEDLDSKFGNDKRINSLKEQKLHGALTLNFCDGVVQTWDLKLHGRAVKSKE